nr:WD repeat-containing protein 44-like [Ipomoea batatas]GME02277.1 WD repeat-containing protein 44-like [Ipomoea batatas]
MKKAGDEEEEDECFHNSFDRLISSANTSCSSSALPSEEEEEEEEQRVLGSPPNYASVPCFPMGVSGNYDVWISQPSSIEERRLSLLQKTGLSRDPSILRHRPSLSAAECSSSGDREEFFARSVSSDQLSSPTDGGEGFPNIHINNNDFRNSNKNKISTVSGFARSKSEGNRNSSNYASCSSSSPIYKNTEVFSIDSVPPANGGHPIVVNNSQNHSRSLSNVDKFLNGSGSSMAIAVSPKKPPTGRCRNDSTHNEEAEEVLESNGVVGVEVPVCTIKDLGNGKEFVVNEVREDGMWNKLKEVGTGRQLTMEEFEMCVGTSPIVQELMRRQNVEDGGKDGLDSNANGVGGNGSKFKKTGSWLRSIKNVANSVTGYKERRSSDEKDTSSEKGGRRSSSATDDSQDVSFHGPERVRVRQYGKSCKELTALYKSQEISAHNGSIWTIKFSLDGKYLASAGEDCVIHVWQVSESERKGDLLLNKPDDPNMNLLLLTNGSPEPNSISPNLDGPTEKKRRGRSSISRKSVSFDHVLVPETVFSLSEKPICSFQGHENAVLDLSWSKSQQLLSSSMDKTVRLWDLSSNSCLKIFSHSDYVTCIQFNPVDDRYFISGSLDAKVRIWSIPDRQVVDWNDLHEMVTAACYTPDGQSALVGSYKGSCRLYNTSENKLQQKGYINLQNKKKKSHQKKITGFQFVPGSTSEVLVTSSDSRIRVIDGFDLVHKFKGFRNTNTQISASLSADGRYAVCASEDSYVYVWNHEGDSRPSRNKGVTVTQSYEHFYCQDVSVAIPWPGMSDTWKFPPTNSSTGHSSPSDCLDEVLAANHPPTPVEESNDNERSTLTSGCSSSPLNGTISSAMNSYFFDRMSATWPEEKLVSATKMCSPHVNADASVDFSSGLNQSKPAWGMVIVTAGLRGQIRTFQNFGLPIRI